MGDSLEANERGGDVGNIVDSGSQVEASSEAQASVSEGKTPETTLMVVDLDVSGLGTPPLESSPPESSDCDDYFLDLLVDSLGGEQFDPDLLI